MSAGKGFSLLETLVALAVGAVLGSMLLSLLVLLQQGQADMDRRLGRLENVRTAPLLLVRLTSAAGNRQWAASWRGVESSATELRLRADIDGPAGFPDGEISGSFEALALRLKADQVQLKSGRSNFQPLVIGISDFSWSQPEQDRIVLHLQHAPAPGRSTRRQTYDVEIFLWNTLENLFREQP